MLTLALLAGAFVGFGAFVVLAYRRQWHWTGLPAASAASTGVEDHAAKTLWDWLQLLGIPVALAALAFLLTDAQSNRDQRREDQRAAQQRTTAADAERENTLRTYLAQMSDLMLDRGLLRSDPGTDVRNVARTATLTAVRRLDGTRRGLVVRFLAEARLLVRETHLCSKTDPCPETELAAKALLTSADLTDANLSGTYLHDADLSEVNLSGAHLTDASLVDADLAKANLSEAMLRGAVLVLADLRQANLSEAMLLEADLTRADLTGADLTGADVRRAVLDVADLSGANLSGANLSGANLSKANLSGANLRRANLDAADLRGARGVDRTGWRGKVAHGP